MFNNVLNGKKRFLHNKNVILTKWDKVHFSKEVNPMISFKNWKFLLCLIFLENDLDMMFNNVLNGKKGFLDYKNVILT